MSNSIKDLLDYNLVKKCTKCGFVKLISNFYFRKDKNKYINHCNSCISKKKKEWNINNIEKKKLYHREYKQRNKEKIKENNKKYYQQNREKINKKNRIYEKERLKNDVNFRLIRNTRVRIYNALNGNSKSKSSREILGINIETYKKWIEFQMTPDMNWTNIHIDHVKPISSFNVVNEDEFLEAFNWKNTQPLLKEDNLRKGIKYNELDYQLQFTKADEFLKLNGETVSD